MNTAGHAAAQLVTFALCAGWISFATAQTPTQLSPPAAPAAPATKPAAKPAPSKPAATQSNNEAEVLSDQGRFAEAEVLLRDALRVWGAAHYELGIALATSNLGRVAARAGRHADGLALLEDAADRFGRIGARGYVDETRARIAECLVLAGRTSDSAAAAVESLARVRHEAATSVLEAQLERTLGWCALQRGDAEAATAHLEASLVAARALTAVFEVALTLRAWLAIPAPSAHGRDQARQEAATILAGLGVLTVAEPPLP